MKVNVGSVDRLARILVGLVLVGLAVSQTLGPWAYIGIVLLATGVLRSCPLYSVLGWNTCSREAG
ncbi:MAG TPA: DUF2892 domain-containing protein [Burkholderiaceae bacterium]|nr:DUF2892 domain-containing protein [Burkholderiaceae bacterium]